MSADTDNLPERLRDYWRLSSLLREAAFALEAKDTEIERLRQANYKLQADVKEMVDWKDEFERWAEIAERM